MRNQLTHIPIQEQHLHGELRGHKRIIGSNQVGKLPPAKWKRWLVKHTAKRHGGQGPRPTGNRVEAFEPCERFVTSEQFIAALARKCNFESGFRSKLRDPVGVQSIYRGLVESPDGVVEMSFNAASFEGHRLQRNAERLC